VKTFGNAGKYKITTTFMINDQSENTAEIVESKLNEGLKTIDPSTRILSSAKVGPTIANDIKVASVWAAILALFGIGLYVLIRFQKWQYALGAIIALAHDVLMMLGFYSIFDGILPFPWK
jgi:SecD/SecF fusion protein